MSTPDDDAADRGARFLGKLLARDPEELDVADDAEVERQMDAAGVKAGPVPGLDELVARAEAKASGASDVRTKQAAGSSSKLAATRSSGPRTSMAPPRARWTAVNVAAAAAVAAVAVGVLVTNRRGLFGPGEGEGIRPDDWGQGRTSAGPTAAPSGGPTATGTGTADPVARAKELRATAKAACDAHHWHACGAALDDASAIDPAGEDTPEVIKLRHQVFDGITSKGPK